MYRPGFEPGLSNGTIEPSRYLYIFVSTSSSLGYNMPPIVLSRFAPIPRILCIVLLGCQFAC